LAAAFSARLFAGVVRKKLALNLRLEKGEGGGKAKNLSQKVGEDSGGNDII